MAFVCLNFYKRNDPVMVMRFDKVSCHNLFINNGGRMAAITFDTLAYARKLEKGWRKSR